MRLRNISARSIALNTVSGDLDIDNITADRVGGQAISGDHRRSAATCSRTAATSSPHTPAASASPFRRSSGFQIEACRSAGRSIPTSRSRWVAPSPDGAAAGSAARPGAAAQPSTSRPSPARSASPSASSPPRAVAHDILLSGFPTSWAGFPSHPGKIAEIARRKPDCHTVRLLASWLLPRSNAWQPECRYNCSGHAGSGALPGARASRCREAVKRVAGDYRYEEAERSGGDHDGWPAECQRGVRAAQGAEPAAAAGKGRHRTGWRSGAWIRPLTQGCVGGWETSAGRHLLGQADRRRKPDRPRSASPSRSSGGSSSRRAAPSRARKS